VSKSNSDPRAEVLTQEPSEQVFVSPGLGRGLELAESEHGDPFELLRFDPLYRRAEFGGFRVRRRHFLSSDLWLIGPDGRPTAVAHKLNYSLGLRYRLESERQELELLGSRDELLWQLLEHDVVIGELRALPFDRTRRRLTLPRDTPDEVLGFIVALSEMVRHNPSLILLDRALRAYSWSS
jgi:hypothetical protein